MTTPPRSSDGDEQLVLRRHRSGDRSDSRCEYVRRVSDRGGSCRPSSVEDITLIIQVSHRPTHGTPVQHKYQDKSSLHPWVTLQHRPGMGDTDSCIAWPGA